MNNKMNIEEYIQILNKIYIDNKIRIIKWNGYCGKLEFLCDKCNQIHQISDARNLIQTKDYCKKSIRTNQKFTFESFLERMNKLHDNFEIIEYTGLSNELKYKCTICGEIKAIIPARMALSRQSLCDDCYGKEKNIIQKKIYELFNNSNKYQLLSYRGSNNKTKIKCLKCGEIFERYPHNILGSFDVCPHCNNGAVKQQLPIEEVQRRIDEAFGVDRYILLEYTGQLHKNSKIKCNNCNIIFNAKISTFINSRGCPKCERFHSKGEQLVERYLKENNIKYEVQKRFKDCNNNLSSFDFCAYDEKDNIHLIEVNGIQHYKDNQHLGLLKDNQRRDKIKFDYCIKNNINLIIIPYNQLNYKDINNYLSFLKGSTTIS